MIIKADKEGHQLILEVSALAQNVLNQLLSKSNLNENGLRILLSLEKENLEDGLTKLARLRKALASDAVALF